MVEVFFIISYNEEETEKGRHKMSKTFKDYLYTRPNYEEYKETFQSRLEKLKNAEDVATARQAIEELNVQQGTIDTMMNLYMIRFSVNMEDEFYKAEDDYWNEYLPKFEDLTTQYAKVLAETPFKGELEDAVPEPAFLLAENQVKVFNESIIELKQEENKLSTAYNNLIASAQIEFNGKKNTLPKMVKYTTDKNRKTRKAASEAVTSWYEEHEAEFDEIYDKMVKNRHQQALKLGYKDYVEMSYDRMNRFGYDRKDVEKYRQQILEYVVPVAQKLYARQAKRIGLEKMAYYDLPVGYPDGNATPKGTTQELLAHAQKMYHELSPETGEFFDFMLNHELLDLETKKGKQSGGYCTFIFDEKSPYIFANYNGTSGDVDVLTHEAGHAFQVFQSQWIKDFQLIWPTIEAAEIFSMSMEFITWPWMDGFFREETQKYKFSHLSGALEFLPYGVLVDHFQHEVYEHPTWTPEERKAAWRKLEKLYKPELDYSESEGLERGIFWYRQGHIFDVPFYYIDYTLAQVVAFQFWKRFEVDKDDAALGDYLKIAKLGGTKTFLEIVAAANLKSPFEEGSLEATILAIDDYLENISEDVLK